MIRVRHRLLACTYSTRSATTSIGTWPPQGLAPTRGDVLPCLSHSCFARVAVGLGFLSGCDSSACGYQLARRSRVGRFDASAVHSKLNPFTVGAGARARLGRYDRRDSGRPAARAGPTSATSRRGFRAVFCFALGWPWHGIKTASTQRCRRRPQRHFSCGGRQRNQSAVTSASFVSHPLPELERVPSRIRDEEGLAGGRSMPAALERRDAALRPARTTAPDFAAHEIITACTGGLWYLPRPP